MNSTSFGERGGSVGRVDDGKIRVDCPGALGCTTTGSVADSPCCAKVGSEKKHVKAPAAMSVTLNTVGRLNPALKGNGRIGFE